MEPVTLDDPRHQRALEWVTTAPAQREPKTQLALADEIGVSARTIRDWMERDDFKAAWKSRVDSLVGSPERTQRLLDSLYDEALDPQARNRVAAAKLYFEVTKAISPPEVNVNVAASARDLSDERLRELIAAGASQVLAERGQ